MNISAFRFWGLLAGFVLLAGPALAQQTISGTVTDGQSGETLPGVNILVKGTATGTSTDARGAYQLSAGSLQDTLVFSFVGYQQQEVPINGRTAIDMVLQSQTIAGDELVVTALGIEREQRSLTYSIQDFDGAEINTAKETNVANALQGKVAGVTITKNATGPGSESKVLIRGNRSLTNSNEPLYIVDGVPITGGLDMLNSDNIENISVLKGASAAALYGSQGQNGAIVITTKSGSKEGPITVNYNSGFNFHQALILPDLQYQYAQGDVGNYDSNSENSFGPKIQGQDVELWNGKSMTLQSQEGRLKDFFRTGKSFNNTLSIQGGNEEVQAYFSYGNTTSQGILPNNDYRRHNINLNINSDISSRLSITTKLNYIIDDVDNRVVPGDGGNYVLPSIFQAPTSIPLSEMKKYSYTDDQGVEKQSYWNPGSSVKANPYWSMNRILFNENKDRIIGTLSMKYKLFDWVDIQLRGNLDRIMREHDEKIYADNYWSQVGSNYQFDEGRTQGIHIDGLISFDHSLGNKFNIAGNIGASIRRTKYKGESGDAGGLHKPNYFFMNNAKAPFITTSEAKDPEVQSLYGKATLSYKNYVFLDATGRNDWSSALPKNDQSYFYPSLGLSAIITDMLQLPSWITYGKISSTYSSVGYSGQAYLTRNYYSVGSGGSILTPSINSINNYKPEKTNSVEFGLNWRFLDDKLGFDLTYYKTLTKNQLLLIGTPPASLYREKYINAGEIENRGIEFRADIEPINQNDFTLDFSFNFQKNDTQVNKLTENINSVILNEGDDVYTVKAEEGKGYGEMYAKGWKRDEKGRKLVNADGAPILTQGLDVHVGNYNPDYMLGVSGSLGYKNYSLSFLIDHRQGGTIFSQTQALIDAYGDSEKSLRGRENGIILDAYTESGEKNTSVISSQEYFSLIGGRYPSGAFYSYPATNTRLRELVLSYRVSEDVLSKIVLLRSAQISLVGRNLFFFHNSAPVDPEVTRGLNGGGLEYAALPSTRNFGFNVKLSF